MLVVHAGVFVSARKGDDDDGRWHLPCVPPPSPSPSPPAEHVEDADARAREDQTYARGSPPRRRRSLHSLLLHILFLLLLLLHRTPASALRDSYCCC